MNRSLALIFWTLILMVAAVTQSGCRRADDTANLIELQRARSEGMDVVLLSSHNALRHDKDTLTIEFRSSASGQLVDAGTVHVSATMSMPGMPMFANIEVRPTNIAGRYTASSNFSMAGTWSMMIEWDGPAGRGSVSFLSSVD